MGYGDRSLFDNATLSLIMGRRYGIVGANGAGKSTFLKIIIGDIAPRKGEVSIASGLKIGTLGQDQFEYDAMNISDVTVSGNTRLFQAMKQKEELLKSGATGSEKAGRKLAELEMVIDEENGYQAEAEAAEILHGLGLSGDVKCISMGQLSGGYKIRVLLARCLFSRPDILLLDEPTNNLDIHSIIWLEEYLKSFRGLLVFISHDRRFLNNVSTDILDLDYTEVIAYKGNYDQAVGNGIRDKEIGRQEKEVADKKKFIERFSAKASKARQANSRKKQLERMPDIEIKRSTRAKPNFRFDVRQRSGKEVIKIQNISKALAKSFHNDARAKAGGDWGERRGQITLLKIITGNLPADSGTIEPGYALSIGYFSQNHKDLLPDDTTPYEWLYESASGETITYVRSLLGRILLTGDDVNKKSAR
ncbi:hypothetical protein CHS0354_026829 [Potamilus streckersoni]|uniref:ABC transporter domain-containing protein n=1 Tax=Potamilus streckersoni TaxID=2493646 RepID=A0AAE0T6E6_9BIVA|nr:hypothetical protein CHS0354_026829 [Potamilus streckersoni]